jgi:hypothetical protein
MSVGTVKFTALREFSLVLGKNGAGGFVESVATADGIELKTAFDVAQKKLNLELLIHESCCTIAPCGPFLDEINSGAQRSANHAAAYPNGHANASQSPIGKD